jgi:hypothetical protein
MKKFFIETRNKNFPNWSTDGVGSNNEFDSLILAKKAIKELKSLGEDWKSAEYRIREVNKHIVSEIVENSKVDGKRFFIMTDEYEMVEVSRKVWFDSWDNLNEPFIENRAYINDVGLLQVSFAGMSGADIIDFIKNINNLRHVSRPEEV